MVTAIAEDADWFKSAVVYQIYPRSFADSDGDGIGDIPGITAHVDYLAELGVDVVWLSPVYRSPMDDNGYDISDYQDVDPLFGSLDDLDELIAALHSRGIKLVMDLVVNHTSDEHPWFVESRSSVDNPKRDWYWWRPPRDGFRAGQPGAEPTDWVSAFSGPAWELDDTTGEYYLHIFSRRQPDLNWENPEVRAAVYEMMRWWLDRGVDGFRMDVINFISKVTPLTDGRDDGAWRGGAENYITGPRIHEFLHEMHEQVFTGRERALLTVGEMPGVTVDEAVRFTDPARAEVDMVFQFEHVAVDLGPGGKWDPRPFRLSALKEIMGRWQAGLAETGWNSLYWDNHDQPRGLSRFGDDDVYRVESAKALATVLHMHRGTPYVYQGDEIGMTNFPFTSIDQARDIETLNHYAEAIAAGADGEAIVGLLRHASRDNARTPMQWDDSAEAGFTVGTPWIAVNPNYQSVNAAAAQADPDSVFAHFQALITLRHEEPVVANGDFTMLLPDHEQIYAFTRAWKGTELLVVANLSGRTAVADQIPHVGEWENAELVLTNSAGPDPSQPRMSLRPWEARVYLRTV